LADNVEITPGSGTKVATDEVTIAGTKVQVQRIKPVIGADGAGADVSSSNPMPVSDAGGSLTVDGTVSVGGSLPAGSNSIGQVDPRGNVNHDVVDSGNPVKVGGRAKAELPTAVADNDRADMIMDRFGRQLTTVATPEQRVSATINRTNAESGQLAAALAAGAYVVTAIMVTNASATVSTKVEILDAATVKWRGYAFKEGGGFFVSDPNGLFVTTKNQALNGKCVTTGADVDITISAYKIPA
jgi:hypothetical protein